MKSKKVSRYIDWGYGFPVVLVGATLVFVRGVWTPRINYNLLAKEVMRNLVSLPARLTGYQARFIRLELNMTLEQFASRLMVSHPAVLKWEKAGDKPTGMNWSTEKDIRLFAMKSLKTSDREFCKLYADLENAGKAKPTKLKIEAKVAA